MITNGVVYHDAHLVAVKGIDDPELERPNNAILEEAPEMYERFDEREEGVTKALLTP